MAGMVPLEASLFLLLFYFPEASFCLFQSGLNIGRCPTCFTWWSLLTFLLRKQLDEWKEITASTPQGKA